MQGVQLYIEIQDQDMGHFNQWGANEPDELVDILLIDHGLEVGEELPRQNHTGQYQYVTMDLTITVLCAQNFQGSDCTQCVSGFTGPNCADVDNCVEINCSEHGQCVDEVDSFRCNCSTGFTGMLCEINIDDCLSNPCGERGQCVDGVNTFDCVCDPGFTGEVCQTNIYDCVGVNCSGNGECMDGVNSFTCQCSPGFSGPLCAEGT